MESEFQSKIEPIRPKTLRNFLKIYYYAYIKKGKFLEYLFTGELLDQTRKEGKNRTRKPKIWPGIWRIRTYLENCSKATAQDYLRAVQVTRKYFVQHELQKVRKVLVNAAECVEQISDKKKREGKGKEGFEPEDCAKILRELASRLIH